MNAINEQMTPAQVEFTLNGKTITARADETIIQAAKAHGVEIPHLCYKEGLRPDGNCRACVVEIKGERVLAPSCCRFPTNGMNVTTDSERAVHSQKMVLELLKSDVPEEQYVLDNELTYWFNKMEVGTPRFDRREQPAEDISHPAMAVNLDACIQCNRCVRACREEQVNDVIGYAFRGAHSKIVFDLDDPMGESTCVGCGECVQACPTGALAPARGVALIVPDKKVESVCPYCGVGCQLTYNVKDNKILYVEGRDGPANESRLCVKGRFGFDYVHHKHRLTKPLIRRADAPKVANFEVDPSNWSEVFREATWEEALEVAINGLKTIRDRDGKYALAGFGSAKGSNEEAYLFQKLVRTGFGSNNIDHCTRLCHASSVIALLEGIGSGAVSNPMKDVTESEVIMIIGSNPTVNHPVGATWMKNAAKNGTKIILADPRRTDISRHATYNLNFKPGTDVAMLNAMMYTIVEEGLADQEFINSRTSGFDALKENLKGYSPEAMESICGIDAATLRAAARDFAKSKASMILWGMGVSQHVHGTDNSRCLIALTMLTGQIGRPGTGLHPLRGQNNVQGASDAGLIPMVYPDYQRVDNPEVQAFFEKLWGVKLDSKPGLTVVEIVEGMYNKEIKGLYIMGENPAMSDPDANHAREAMAKLECLVVQDIFLTETAYLADVVLPTSAFPEKTGTFSNSDRMVQMGRQALNPPGEARQDLWIIQDIANGLGCGWNYKHVSDVFNEMRKAMPSIAGMTWERLEKEHVITYPCEKEGDPGSPVIFIEDFPTETGRAKLVPADIIPPAERPDAEFPFVLITGRQLEHWHTGSMTRRASVLDAIEPTCTVLINPLDLDKIGAKAGETITLESRRGKIGVIARADAGTPAGSVFIPFAYYEAAANKLTNAALDPFAKIPEFKYCAIKISKGGALDPISSYGGGQALAEIEALA